jgi:hypothetical protein
LSGSNSREYYYYLYKKIFIHNLLEWGMEDPKGKPIEKVREIRDNMEESKTTVKSNPQLKY